MEILERETLLVVSASHIEQRDAERLTRYARRKTFPPINGGLVAETRYGYLLWIGSEGPCEDHARLLAKARFSPALATVIAFAHAQARGFCYLMIDQDCETIDALPAYDW